MSDSSIAAMILLVLSAIVLVWALWLWHREHKSRDGELRPVT